jgi:4'-phosphopantetheinyl transferase
MAPVSPQNEIDLWLVNHDRLGSSAMLDLHMQVLSKEEITRGEKFRSQADRLAYLVTRIAQRLLLSRYTGVKPKALRFLKTPHGRPVLSNPPSAQGGFDFNISHDGNLTVLGFARGGAIGIDVMTTRARSSYMNVARRFFCGVEADALARLPEPLRAIRFMEYWTLKEAYVKACGPGLSMKLNSFYFLLDEPGRIDFFTPLPTSKAPILWNFWQFKLAPNVIIAVCAQQANDPNLSVNLREFCPIETERPITCVPWRTCRKQFSSTAAEGRTGELNFLFSNVI